MSEMCKCCGNHRNNLIDLWFTGKLCLDCNRDACITLGVFYYEYRTRISPILKKAGLDRIFECSIRNMIKNSYQVEVLQSNGAEGFYIKYLVVSDTEIRYTLHYTWSLNSDGVVDGLLVTYRNKDREIVGKYYSDGRKEIIEEKECDNSNEPIFKYSLTKRGFYRYNENPPFKRNMFHLNDEKYLVKPYTSVCPTCRKDKEIIFEHSLSGPLCEDCLKKIRDTMSDFELDNITSNLDYIKLMRKAVIEYRKTVPYIKLVGVLRNYDKRTGGKILIYHSVDNDGNRNICFFVPKSQKILILKYYMKLTLDSSILTEFIYTENGGIVKGGSAYCEPYDTVLSLYKPDVFGKELGHINILAPRNVKEFDLQLTKEESKLYRKVLGFI